MTSLIDIQSQIEALQKQAEEIKANELQNTVQDILVKMQAFGIGVKDLLAANPALAAGSGKSKSKSHINNHNRTHRMEFRIAFLFDEINNAVNRVS